MIRQWRYGGRCLLLMMAAAVFYGCQPAYECVRVCDICWLFGWYCCRCCCFALRTCTGSCNCFCCCSCQCKTDAGVCLPLNTEFIIISSQPSSHHLWLVFSYGCSSNSPCVPFFLIVSPFVIGICFYTPTLFFPIVAQNYVIYEVTEFGGSIQ